MQLIKQPFEHYVIEDAVPAHLAEEASKAVPVIGWPGWEAVYDNDCERGKQTCRRLDILPPAWKALLDYLNSSELVAYFGQKLKVKGLQADPTLHGGGLHVTHPGGHLSPHIDYALHQNGLERRVNVVLFLNREWKEEWGGAFECWDDTGSNVVSRVYPTFNKAVIWCPGDVEFHGTQRIVRNLRCVRCGDVLANESILSSDACKACWPHVIDGLRVGERKPKDIPPPRVTAAVYYLAKKRGHVTRKRALFVPARKSAPSSR